MLYLVEHLQPAISAATYTCPPLSVVIPETVHNLALALAVANQLYPMHLWFIVHGLYGKTGNMDVMHEALQSALPASDHIHVASSNELIRTFEGIDIGGLRLYNELRHVVASASTPITHISIIGYSLGGLYTRYLIGLLEETGFFDTIEPVIYTTFASPHLGSLQWSPRFGFLLNGLGSTILGVSGAQLLCRWSWGTVHKLSEPNSKYMLGLKRFKRRLLFANAVNDRSVHFWTAFITDKVPFAKEHGHTTELAFYSFNGDPEGRFILDLQRSRHLNVPNISESGKKETSINLGIFIIVPTIFVALSFFSLRAWLFYPFLHVKWRSTYRSWQQRPLNANESEEEENDDSEETRSHDFAPQAQNILDTLPPKDAESSEVGTVTAEPPATSEPQPVLHNKAAFIDSATKALPFSNTMKRRMNNLNSLEWEKYAVYLKQSWSHAHIINRNKSGTSQGPELLKFFAQEVSKTKV